MTTTSVDDAIILPQSQGTGLGGEESVIDAAINGVLNRYVGGEYVSSTYSTGLAFQNHSSSNDKVEVGPGIVFVQDNSTSTSGERGSGGNPQAESSTTSGYDTELPEGHTYAVLLPTATEISVSDSTLNEVYVDLADVTVNNSVNLEHDGSSTASPGNTSLKIGETNPDDASADTRANDDASPTFDSLTVNGTTTTNALNAGQVNGVPSVSTDSELDAAINDASDGDLIRHANITFTSSRTITKDLSFIGKSAGFSGTTVDAVWTLDGSVSIERIQSGGSTDITFNANNSSLKFSDFANTTPITVAADDFRYIGNNQGDVTFNSGTSGGIVDAGVNVTVTDNGSNTVGDIS